MVRLLALALAVVGLAAAGCGSSSNTASTTSGAASTQQGTPSASSWTGLGAKLPEWESVHPRGTEGCSAGYCYGGKVQLGPNESQYEFITVETSGPPDNRVDGYTQALGEGVIVAAAKAAVLKLLPSDTRTLAFWVEHQNGSCASWNVRSATLGRWFAANPKVGDPQGIIGINLYTPNSNGESEYSPNKVSLANVGVAPERHGISC
jgi:ABC-type Fe3+-hydroxamate transport system substrate-binding protein